MATVERLRNVGTRRGERCLREIGEECRHARLRLGLSQREIAAAAGIDRADYSRFERARLERASVIVACRVGAVLGLDIWMRAFPGGRSLRDAGQARHMQRLIEAVGPPLTCRLEVPLPPSADRHEQRAWDLVILGHGMRTAVEFETRLYDLQAQMRRWALKRRDDPVERFLVVLADTRANRRSLAEFADVLADVPRLRTDVVLRTLRAGSHPPTGLVLLHVPRSRRRPELGISHH